MRRPCKTRRKFCVVSFWILGLAALGCGGGTDDRPDIGEVEGTVKMDDKPLTGATVTFQPENGRPSSGITDEAGHYALSYRNDVPGAAVGKHQVKISTYREDNPDSDDPALQKGQKETVPTEYNNKSKLTADVKAGENVIDFTDLKSGGKIEKPE